MAGNGVRHKSRRGARRPLSDLRQILIAGEFQTQWTEFQVQRTSTTVSGVSQVRTHDSFETRACPILGHRPPNRYFIQVRTFPGSRHSALNFSGSPNAFLENGSATPPSCKTAPWRRRDASSSGTLPGRSGQAPDPSLADSIASALSRTASRFPRTRSRLLTSLHGRRSTMHAACPPTEAVAPMNLQAHCSSARVFAALPDFDISCQTRKPHGIPRH